MGMGEISSVSGVFQSEARATWRLREAAGVLRTPKEMPLVCQVAEIAAVWAFRIGNEIGCNARERARLAGFARVATLARLNRAPISRGAFGRLYQQISAGEVVPRSPRAFDVAIVIVAERFAVATMLSRDRERTPNRSVRELCADTQPLLAETARALARMLGYELVAA